MVAAVSNPLTQLKKYPIYSRGSVFSCISRDMLLCDIYPHGRDIRARNGILRLSVANFNQLNYVSIFSFYHSEVSVSAL